MPALVAQGIEQQVSTLRAAGSNPAEGTNSRGVPGYFHIGGTMNEKWLDESVSWSAEYLVGMHYLADQDDWEEFKDAVQEFVQHYLEELNYE